MLEHVHIVNFVLIDDIDIDFGPGLNILTGETGAGKSIILGSINLALGAKADKNYADYAYIEMVFSIDNEKQKEVLQSLDIYPDDNLIVISRKIMENKSIARVCGEAVSNHNLKLISSIFLDVYGQRDYQVLLRNEMHISILDDYIGSDLNSTLSDYKNAYDDYLKVKSSLADLEAMLKNKDKEMSLLEYQIDEIEKANLHKGEEEEIKAFLDVAENSKKILDVLNKVKRQIRVNGKQHSATMHYIINYGYIPMWILVKVLSFGIVSELYGILDNIDQKEIADIYNLDIETLMIYLSVLSYSPNKSRR